MDGEGPLSPHVTPDPSAAVAKQQTMEALQGRDGLMDSSLARVIGAVSIMILAVLVFLGLLYVWGTFPVNGVLPDGDTTVT